MIFNKILRRIYDDFFRPSKEKEYELIITTAKSEGYEFHTVLSFENVLKEGINPLKKYLILRRDIDTADYKIIRKFLEIEKKYGARSTSYFRWNTYNSSVMNEICDGGGESSYHYEEIALYCSQYRKLSKEFVNEHLEDIRNLFISNYLKFKEKTGHPCLTVAAHGDFINVKLKLSNSIIVDDRVRKETGILREAYDAAHMNALTCRIADQVERGKFVQKSIDAIN